MVNRYSFIKIQNPNNTHIHIQPKKMAHPIRIPNPNPNPSSSSIDPNSGFCSETKSYHSIRPHSLLPPETTSLSITDFVFSLLLQNSPSSPETTAALIDAATRRRIPYPDVVTRTKTLAASLHHQIGLSNGHSAFVLSPNSVQIPILYLSLFSLGVTVSASNPTSSKSEISRQIDLSKPVIAFAISDTAHNLPSLLHRTIILDSPEFESMMTNRTRKFHRISVSQSDTAAILYSSGTTGKSKGVELSHRNFISSLAGSQASRPVRFSPAVSFCAVPYFHVYGFLLCVTAVAMGESLVSFGRFDVGMMIRAIDEFRVTRVALAPPVIVAMVRKGDLMDGGHDLSSLEVVGCGGAPLPNAVIERFKKRFPGVLVAQSYGLTESTGGISRTIGLIESQILGSSGRLMSYCQAKIVDVETGINLPPFKHGELWVGGPYIMKGYVNDKEATAAIMDSEGWLRTGDICYFDNEGFLYVVDRIKELIKYKGYQVAPVELENLLQTHPHIVDAAVVPYPDEEAGQVPMAFVVRQPESTIDESQIKDFIARQVAPYKKIRRVLFIDSIPKNAPGKVLRKELIKLALSDSGVSSKL
ncbi:4-coumarate--CoA ligase-like 9 [Camellia sinensis]|uniref:4-coumarate--CoA ligase-like 9 n=1 Tax=Camellia sinensis TaxID=4442 RepID=UPI001035F481|nr:4-coumarate--CoA ligase-like 9 [Camellia sinensis]